MSRLTAVLDRIIVFVIGLVLVALGAFAIVWWRGSLTEVPTTLKTSVLDGVTLNWWWPWALLVSGLVVVVLVVRWLIAHLPRRGMSAIRLPGSEASGRMRVDANAVASAAADELAQAPGVRSMKAKLVDDRGQSVLSMHGPDRRRCRPQRVRQRRRRGRTTRRRSLVTQRPALPDRTRRPHRAVTLMTRSDTYRPGDRQPKEHPDE